MSKVKIDKYHCGNCQTKFYGFEANSWKLSKHDLGKPVCPQCNQSNKIEKIKKNIVFQLKSR